MTAAKPSVADVPCYASELKDSELDPRQPQGGLSMDERQLLHSIAHTSNNNNRFNKPANVEGRSVHSASSNYLDS